jgi:hypothetical protein
LMAGHAFDVIQDFSPFAVLRRMKPSIFAIVATSGTIATRAVLHASECLVGLGLPRSRPPAISVKLCGV